MGDIIQQISKRRASENTVYHALYGYFFLGLSKAKLALLYRKHISTITNWITNYQTNGGFSRKEYARDAKKFGAGKRQWLVELYKRDPTIYLDEAKEVFEKTFCITISASSICRILHHEGFSWKALERRAVQIHTDDIVRFCEELQNIQWDYHNLIFLDEVSFDNRGMLRTRGYGVRGERLICRGEFVRKPRVSLLCFIAQNGMKEVFSTEGTFNRSKFFDCCRKFITNSTDVEMYPGQSSVWILDGARIHCDPMIIYYLRSVGIIPIFLPAYCPFFNPIEVVFGLSKQRLKKTYTECACRDMLMVVAEVMEQFSNYPMENLFRKCGYIRGGRFDPTIELEKDLIQLGFEENSEKQLGIMHHIE